MSTPTRLDNGVTNVGRVSPFAAMGMLVPQKFHTWFDDFDKYTAGDWTITTTEGGAGDATEAISNADGGVLLITNDDADNDADHLQWASETFLMAAGKKAWFAIRVQTSDATQSDIQLGLAITDTTPLDASDGIWFQKDDGDANVDFHVTKNGTATSSTAVTTMADATWIELAWYYNGDDEIEVWADGAKVGTSATTNLPDDEELAITFGIVNGAAAAKTMSIDWLFVAKER